MADDSFIIRGDAYKALHEELVAFRHDVHAAREQVEMETDLYVASTRLADWIDRESAIAFMMTDCPAMLIAGCDYGEVKRGTILFATRELHRLFRYAPPSGSEPGELTGVHVNRLVPPHLRAAHASHLDAFFAAPSRRAMSERLEELLAFTRDGKVFSVRISLRPRVFNSRLIVLATVVQTGPKREYTMDPDVGKLSWTS